MRKITSCSVVWALAALGMNVAPAHAVTPPAPAQHWVGAWAAAPFAAKNSPKFGKSDGGQGSTLREIVHLTMGGSSVRIVFTNEFGREPLAINAATVAQGAADGAVSGTPAPLMFGGMPSIIIPAGAMAVSDPVKMKVSAFEDLAISFYLPDQEIAALSSHGSANQTNYRAEGNAVSAPTLTGAKPFYSWEFIKGVNVAAGPTSAAIVAFGDSITDGAHSTRDANTRWPDELARRLQASKLTAHLSVLNEGIGGNRILHDVTGPSALARFDRDVIAQDGVKYLIILESINDIGRTTLPNPALGNEAITADELIQGMKQMIDRAHAHGIRVFGATLTPYEGAKYMDANGETMREAVNEFIRHGGKFDGVIDFDKATLDAAHPHKFLPAYDSGDNLHPNDAGYKAMGDSIDLKLFR